jgi:hypothetical protein
MSLFEGPAHIELSQEPLSPGATTLRNFTVTEETEILLGFHDGVSGPVPRSHVGCNDKLPALSVG